MIHVPLITPFGPDGRVDTRALEALARQVLADGASGLVALGTTGEPAALEDDERAEVAATVGRVCRERGARFVVGAGAGSTRRAARELAALAGARVIPDAALVTVPSFTRPGEAGVLAHFRELAAAGPVPLLVYHVPHRTGQPLTARALRQLAAIPGVIGVKYATGGIDAETVGFLGDHPAGFAVLAGDDALAPALLALGADGAVLASAHLATARWAELAATGDRHLGHRLAGLGAALFREPNPAVVKAVLHAHGRIPTPDVRLPLLPASPEALRAALAAEAAVGIGPAAGTGPVAGEGPGPAAGRAGTGLGTGLGTGTRAVTVAEAVAGAGRGVRSRPAGAAAPQPWAAPAAAPRLVP
ncbi:dihydrodipicolinate synthase family protein [Actinacidiphila sp. ITFR-21]|uniref:dihydrodipicolinate synthase family protein n=1 Tax=Actinacidiphila sp. ITFR-21 TaxID=3075199 RepID=UPI00288A18D9|nr:dihydrodipicolinate synthase family protein [Streptomyces sp. ITFR-21]WNI17023.1 dihydrodipicolinate synthase family protein [Streptomyces sp. ITFR-21]